MNTNLKILNNNIVEIAITEQLYKEAMKLLSQQYTNTKNSLFSGEKSIKTNITGILGELLFLELFPEALKQNTFNYDFILNDKKIDIKTKECKTIPRLCFDASIFIYNFQKCDYYVFCRISNDLKVGWICGYISSKDMKEKGKFWKTGDTDPTNNFTFKKDCCNILLSELSRNFKGLING